MLTWEETAVAGEPGTTGAYAHYQIIRRNGSMVPFEFNKIAPAMMKAFMAVHGAWAFAQSICSGWLHGFWHPLKPSRVSAQQVIVQLVLIAPFMWLRSRTNLGICVFSAAASSICATHPEQVLKTQSP